ncbi:HsdM family class I SAM-dependent methyltransferase [Luteimonas aquatica]|uniref:HsdM family class I SAM-dependent methyltransferase n=1 Tax=Luteimonas aquatica TaxID=450364 RepID=UPI001F582461|nr:N-6 DNA methylase [Luteimonas aquatica]
MAVALGTPIADVVTLQEAHPDPEHLDFLGLMQARQHDQPVPDAVVLHEGQPLLYVWDCSSRPVGDDAELRRALGRLALRSDAPYVAILRPGTVQVFALASVQARTEPLMQLDELAPGLIARLAVGDVPSRSDGYTTHQLMLELLKAVTEELIGTRGVTAAEALALVGRAVFLRFLSDRGLLPARKPLPGVADFRDCLATPAHAAASCRWLDDTFNGDLLELPDRGSEAYFQRLAAAPGGSALQDLSAIIRGDKPVGDGAYQTQFSWADLHFSYIPVGLLSQVYEEYAHRFEEDDAREKSVYYTPRHLAEYMVDHAMVMLGPAAHLARVLDPASGGGVFLLAAFRRLVQARWRATGVQPDTETIREILNTQLVGIEINPAARQLSALALYLTALELDPNVGQLKHLKFKALQSSVLLSAEYWRDATSGLDLGSLSLPVPPTLAGQFDLVVGNPPWTAVKDKPKQQAIDAISRSAMADRGITPVSNPDGVPDLPFVWQATRCAKPGAVMAFALHGRLLTKTTEQGVQARQALFNGLDVTYVLNGLELRNTRVWPNMTAHFCLLFARNRTSDQNSRFYAVTPVEDQGLNREGRVRIDSKDAWASDPTMVGSIPHLFKTLAKGNALDIELLERVVHQPISPRQTKFAVHAMRPPLAAYLAQWKLAHGHGYQTSSEKEDASEMVGLPEMPAPPDAQWPVVPVKDLPLFERLRLHRTRLKEAIYEPPLVLLREAPSTRPHRPLAMLAFEKVVYRESYNGYSCAGAPDPELLAVYLWAVFNSSLFLYYILMTSSKLGCERSTLQKEEADRFPIVPLEQLTSEQRKRLRAWLKALKSKNPPEIAVNALVEDIYQLRPADHQLIRDRLAVAMPFSAVRHRAVAPPKDDEVCAFCDTLQSMLLPFDMSDTPLQVRLYSQSPLSPWRFLRLGAEGGTQGPSMHQLLTSVSVADSLDSSLVECIDGDAMFIGILNQRRYWTQTAARTLALDLIKRSHGILSRGGPDEPMRDGAADGHGSDVRGRA